jgi:hypothetical protein
MCPSIIPQLTCKIDENKLIIYYLNLTLNIRISQVDEYVNRLYTRTIIKCLKNQSKSVRRISCPVRIKRASRINLTPISRRSAFRSYSLITIKYYATKFQGPKC